MSNSLADRIAKLSPEQRAAVLARLDAEADTGGPFEAPLSPSQQRLWVLDQLEPGNPWYLIPASFRLRGDLDRAALRRALHALAKRHDALRTTFGTTEDGAPVQRVSPEPEVAFRFDDLGGIVEPGAAGPAALAARTVAEESARPCDLSAAPPWRVRLLRLAEDEHLLVLTMHHIVFDGWSLGVVARELFALYEAARADRPAGLEPLPMRYADYAALQRSALDGPEQRAQLAYWRERLAGPLPVLDLPFDRPRTADGSHRGGFCTRLLPRELFDALRRLGRDRGATMFMVFLAAYSALLHRLSGQEDLVVGAPVAGRERPELGGLVGVFVNTLPLRAEIAAERPFDELLAHVRERVLEAFGNQDVPFDTVVEAVRPDRIPAVNPVFQTLFTYQNSLPPLRLAELEVDYEAVDGGTAKLDLSLDVFEGPEGPTCIFEYSADLFDRETAERVADRFQVLLESIVADPSIPVGEVPLVPEEEALRELRDYNDARRADFGPPRRLHELFEEHATASPYTPAVVCGGERVSYGELDGRANRLARRLRELGADRGAHVAICLDRSVDMVVAALAAWKAGAAYVPVDTGYPAERVSFMLDDAEAHLVVTGSVHAQRTAGPGRTLVLLDDEVESKAVAAHSDARLDLPGDPGDAAYVVFTSGTTGLPKGTRVHHAALANAHAGWQHAYGLGTDCHTILAMAAFGFDVATGDLVRALASGCTLVVCPAETLLDAPALYRLMTEERVDCAEFVPAVFRNLADHLEESGRRLVSARVLIVASDTWYAAEHARFRAVCGPHTRLVNSYGVTEATVDSTWFDGEPPHGAERGTVPIGRPFPNVRAYVLDSRRRPVPTGVWGELWIGGSGVAEGYLGRSELTAERFVPDPFTADGGRMYRTGDAVRLRSDGELELLGRMDHQVKLRGFRIEPDEIAAVLARHQDVRDCVVTVHRAVGDGAADPYLVAYLVAARGERPGPERLRAFLGERLPEYMVPAAYVTLDAMPLTPNGKIDRRALPAPSPSVGRPGGSGQAPRTLTEELLAEIWQQEFELPRVGVTDDFFALGGHSLLALRITGRVRRATGVELRLRSLFDEPTVAGLARLVDLQRDAQGSGGAAELPTAVTDSAAAHEPFPLTDVQQAYWIGRSDAFDMGNVSTHSYDELDFAGYDPTRFAAAWNALVRRHGMLRAVVDDDGSQRVLPEVPPCDIPVLDLRGATAERQQAEIDLIRERMSHQVLDVGRFPAFDLRVTRLTDEVARVHLSSDALMFDAWSYVILLKELAELHADPDADLPALEIGFRDYVLTERELEKSPEHRRAEAYWRERAASLPGKPELPMAKSPDEVRAPRFTRHHDRLDPELWSALKARATSHGLTPSGVLLAAYAEVLTRWSASPHFCVNLTFLNRTPIHPQINDVVGEFTSLTLLEVDNRTPECFAVRAQRVQRTLWHDLEHHQVSGVKLLRELNRVHGDVTGARMPVVFTSALTLPIPDRDEVDFPITPVHSITQTSQVWLDCGVWEDERVLYCNWDVVEELFPEGMLGDMFAAYFRLLRRLAQDDEVWEHGEVMTVPAAPAPAAPQRRLAVSGTGLLHEPFFAQAQASGDRPAVITSRGTLSHARLAEFAEGLAARLRRAGTRPDELVAVVMHKGWEQIAAVLGVLRSGAPYLPVDPALPEERITRLLERAGARLAIVGAEEAARPNLPPHVHTLTVAGGPDENVHPETEADDVRHAAPEDLAYVIFTSGSTGEPKGVMIDHRGALNTVRDINDRFGVTSQDRVLALSSLSFDLSVYDVFGVLAAGGALVVPDADAGRDPGHWLELAECSGVTLWNSVPALMGMAVDYADALGATLPAGLRLALLSGDWIPLALPDRIRRLAPHAEVISLGGATEASIWSIARPVGAVDPDWRSIPYGRPLRNQDVRVLDHHLRPCPVWVPGELYIAGTGVALGYWRDPERTAASFLTHPDTGERLYRTGDHGRYLPDGEIEFLGRRDSQVKVQGYRIELGEVEHALVQHPGVREAVAAVVGEQQGSRQLVAFTVPGDETRLPAPSELRAHLRGLLPEYMVPARFHSVPSIPLTANAKVDRARLVAEGASSHATTAREYREPRTDTERRIAAVWTEILGNERVGVEDDFFELGGDSMLAIRVVRRLAETTGVEVPLRTFFRNPRIGSLAETVRAVSTVHTVSVVSPEVAS